MPNDLLIQFVHDMEALVRKRLPEPETLRQSKSLLENLLSAPNPFPDEAFMARGDRFATNLIYMPQDHAFSVMGGVWLPGQITPIHDHLTWAVIGMYEGEEREEVYRRTDDGSNPKKATLKRVSERINRKGDVNVLGSAGLHRIENVTRRPSFSVHLYGLDIGNTKRHIYDPGTGEIGEFLTGYDRVLKILA